jgi:glycosyltransferase involved in cell wall biosynthesis
MSTELKVMASPEARPHGQPSSYRALNYGALLPGVGVFGGVRRFIEIGNELVRRGHQFTLYHPSGERPTWLPFAGDVRPLVDLQSARHDVLVNNDTYTLPQFKQATAGLKLFYCVVEKFKDERRVLTDKRWTVLANSTGLRERMARRYGVQAEAVIGGVDPRVFQPQPELRQHDGPFWILAYGRASRRQKGVPLVVRAVESFASDVSKHREVRLALFDNVGPGNEQDPRNLIDSHLPVDYHLNLSQVDLANLYASCHLFVAAERKAGWSNTVAEAMACGVPVVCTRSGTRDLALHRETAWTVRWRHWWFLKRGIRAMVEDPDLAERLQRNAQRHVQQFSWPHVVDQLEEVVQRRREGDGA